MTKDEERLARIASIVRNSTDAFNAALEMGAVVGLRMEMKRTMVESTVAGLGNVVFPRFILIIHNDPEEGQSGHDNQD